MTIGFLSAMTGAWDIGRVISGALPLAIDAVNANLAVELEGYELGYVWRDSGCNPGQALAGMGELIDLNVDFFIGPACSSACEPTQLLASNRGVPQVRRSSHHRCCSSSFHSGCVVA